MHSDEQPGDREAAGAIEGMLEIYGAPAEPVTDIERAGVQQTIIDLGNSAGSRSEPCGVIRKIDRLLLENVVIPRLRLEGASTCIQIIRTMLDEPFRLLSTRRSKKRTEPVTQGIPLDLLVVDPTELD